MVKSKLLISLLFFSLLLAYYFLGTDYLQQRQQHERLHAQINDATRVLAQMPQPPIDLDHQLAAAQDNLADVEAFFPDGVNSTRVVNAILRLSEDVGIKVIPLATRPWSVEKKGEHDYYVLYLNVSLSGSFSDLETFTARLEDGEFPTLIIESLSVNSPDRQSEEADASELAATVSASLDLAVYARSLSID